MCFESYVGRTCIGGANAFTHIYKVHEQTVRQQDKQSRKVVCASVVGPNISCGPCGGLNVHPILTGHAADLSTSMQAVSCGPRSDHHLQVSTSLSNPISTSPAPSPAPVAAQVAAASSHDQRNTTNAAQLLKMGAFKLQPLKVSSPCFFLCSLSLSLFQDNL